LQHYQSEYFLCVIDYPPKYEVRRQELITEMLCRLSSKGIDAENLAKSAHKHPTNIMTSFEPKVGIPMLG
jgi:hypothetical protein